MVGPGAGGEDGESVIHRDRFSSGRGDVLEVMVAIVTPQSECAQCHRAAQRRVKMVNFTPSPSYDSGKETAPARRESSPARP